MYLSCCLDVLISIGMILKLQKNITGEQYEKEAIF